MIAARFVWGLGAASPRVLSNTIVRDVFVGDRMARVLSLVMSVFLVGPVIAPLIGEGILQLGSWRLVFGAGLLFAMVTIAWTMRLPETLDPDHRIPLGWARTTVAFRAVVRNRATLGYSLGLAFSFGILITLLGSSPLMFDAVFDRASQFAILFSLASAVSAGAAYANSRLVERLGAGVVMRASGAAFVVAGAALTIVSAAADGSPSFWLWFALITFVFAIVNVFIPTGNALAMEAMAHLAGTASAVIGTLSLLGGSLLGMLIDAALVSSVTPMSAGFLIYGSLAWVFVLWAERHVVPPDPEVVAP